MTLTNANRDLSIQLSVGYKCRCVSPLILVVVCVGALASVCGQAHCGMPGLTPVFAGQERPDETERQKEQRAAVEKERAQRGTSVKTLKTKLADAERSKSKGPLQLTFDDLVFDMKKGDKFDRSMFLDEHLQLHHRTVSVSGYIRPSARQSGLTQFVFVRDNMECCFGPGAALFDCILVKLADDEKTEYTVRPVTIEGEFYIKEYTGPNGKAWAVYRLKNGRVK